MEQYSTGSLETRLGHCQYVGQLGECERDNNGQMSGAVVAKSRKEQGEQ